MKKDFRTSKKERFFMSTLAFLMIFILAGLSVSLFHKSTGKNTHDFESTESNIVYIPEAEEYAYSSFDDLTYTSPLKYEYRNFLSEQGKMYYDAFYNEIIVYADMHESIHELSKTIIHEAYHARYNTGTQKEEVACRIEEAKHDGKELNMRGKIDIIKAVKNSIHYNGMPWR